MANSNASYVYEVVDIGVEYDSYFQLLGVFTTLTEAVQTIKSMGSTPRPPVNTIDFYRKKVEIRRRKTNGLNPPMTVWERFWRWNFSLDRWQIDSYEAADIDGTPWSYREHD